MTNSIFESKKKPEKTKKISVPCPVQLVADIEDVKKQLSEVNPDMSFNVDALCIDALGKAVRRAKKELSTMANSPTSLQSTEKKSDGTFDGGSK